MRRRSGAIAFLVALLFGIDQLYRVLHPEVNLVRATLVGATAFVLLLAVERLGLRLVRAGVFAGSIFVSAFLSVIAIQAGWLVSRSALSALVHVALVAAAFLVLDRGLPGPGRAAPPPGPKPLS